MCGGGSESRGRSLKWWWALAGLLLALAACGFARPGAFARALFARSELWAEMRQVWLAETPVAEQLPPAVTQFRIDALAFARSSTLLSLCLTKGVWRVAVHSAPWCRAMAWRLWFAFYALERLWKVRIGGGALALLCAHKVWRDRYVGRLLDAVHVAHYKTSRFLATVVPYVLVLALGYTPLKWWRRGQPAFKSRYEHTLVFIMLICSAKSAIEFSYIAACEAARKDTRGELKSRDAESAAPATLEMTPQPQSPVLVSKLRLLVTPRVSETVPLINTTVSFDAKHRACNAVVVTLSIWVGLQLYQAMVLPLNTALVVLVRVPTLNVWQALFGTGLATTPAASTSLLSTALCAFDEVVFTVAFVGILAQDIALARRVRRWSATVFDGVCMKVTGYSVRPAVARGASTGTGAEWPLLRALVAMLPFGERAVLVIDNWASVKAVAFNFAPALLVVLPSFFLRYIVVVYAGLQPFAASLKAAVAGDAARCHFWLCYVICLFGVILLAHLFPVLSLSSPRLKLLLAVLGRYGLNSPNQFLTLIGRLSR